MAFTDLPADPRDLPVSDPAYTADFLDLVVSEENRHRGALALLLCDDEARMQAPVVVGDLPTDMSDDERHQTVSTVLEVMKGRGSVLVAVARRSGLSIRDGDRAWLRAAARACADGPRLLGVHVITLEGSREVPAQAA